MDTVQITILGKNYTLRTDEEPERITKVAALLEERISEFTAAMKGRSDYEVLTLVAFDLMEQADSSAVETDKLRALLNDTEIKNQQLLIDNMNSAESELFQIAAVKEQENNDLRGKIQDYEKLFEEHAANTYTSAEHELDQIVAHTEKENIELRARFTEFEKQFDDHAMNVFNSAIKEAKENAESKEEENIKLNTMLENFEKTFDDYAKAKERDIVRMQEEIEALKLKLAESSDDGQLTLA
ncbi:MAG: cell division protein ZapA [Oscillospiraceae bacterium]|nr:cell division protein ZapA [Oscillospiraceae bacterium]